MKFQFINLTIIATALLFLSGCGVVTKKYNEVELSSQQNEELYRTNKSGDTLTLATISWRDFFSDPNLKSLIEKGLSNNHDLKNAILQVSNAENILRQSKLAFLPSLDFNPSVTYNQASQSALNFPPNVNINLQTTTVSLGFSTNWEIEIWGKLTAAKRSAQASWMRSVAAQNAIKTALIATISKAYYSLLALDKQLEITEETILIREKTLETIRSLQQAGRATGADLVQAEANLYEAQVSLPDLKKSIREMENMLCVLTAQPLQSITRSEIETQSFDVSPNIGVPAQLLANRPDVQAAELQFRQAFELTNVARASFYPSLRLSSGTGGISALTSRNLFDPNSLFINLAGGLAQPIFQRGMLKTNHRNAQITQQQAWNNFEKTLLTAGQEVSDALFALETAKEKQEIRTQQIQSLTQAVEFRMDLLQYSSNTNYNDVLLSEQGLLLAQLAGINDKLQEYLAFIELYRALGGGWK